MLAPAGAAAQDSVTVRGRVVDSLSGDNLPYVSVMLYPGFAERFSDVAGSFAFAGVAWGSYRLRVRQIGYALYDTLVRVTETRRGPRPPR